MKDEVIEKIRYEYEKTKTSQRTLEKKYNVPKSTISYWAKKYKWRKYKMPKNYKMDKQKKEKAKALIISGVSQREAAYRTGLPTTTINNIVTNEKLLFKQKEFLKKFFQENLDNIKKYKKARLVMNHNILISLTKEVAKYLDKGELVPESLQRQLKLNEDTEQMILESSKISFGELQEERISNDTEDTKLIENIATVYDTYFHPVPNRTIDDIENAEEVKNE